jgi:NADH-quinone oxidoreductase subunit E
MFQLQPVGSVANIQICGTTSCMIMGAEDLVAVCKAKIADKAHTLSEDGKFSWEEVECLGACANAPMAQIGKDYYEDLTPARLEEILDELAAGKVPVPGPQSGRYAAEPAGGLTSLKAYEAGKPAHNASAALAVEIGDTVKRIDGTEVPLTAPWQGVEVRDAPAPYVPPAPEPERAPDPEPEPEPVADTPAPAPEPEPAPVPEPAPAPVFEGEGKKPETLTAPRDGGSDNLKLIKGVGPKLEALCNQLGFYHFDQIAKWTDAEVAWVDDNLEGFKGRVSRDEWVRQARILAEGGETEFSQRAKTKE